MDQERLQKRIRARKSAEEMIEFLEASEVGDTICYWNTLSEYLRSKAPKSGSDLPMSDVEASRFGYQAMPFGEFRGIPIADVPRARLDWYVKQNEEFNSQLIRYLKNEKVAAELAEELK